MQTGVESKATPVDISQEDKVQPAPALDIIQLIREHNAEVAEKGKLHGEKHGSTTVMKNKSDEIKEYHNGDYRIAKHDDGEWYYHQKGSATFVKVEAGSIKMDDQGTVTYNEYGLFGKDNQTLGNGNTGLAAKVDYVARTAIQNPVDTMNTIILPQVAILDAVTGNHVMDAIEQMERGAVNEIRDNPDEVLKTLAIGVAIGALTAATGGGALAALAIGATYFAADELIKNKGDINGVVNDITSMGETFKTWGEDFATVAGKGENTPEEIAQANQGLQQLGAFGTHTVAGIMGNIIGEAAMTTALNKVLPTRVESKLASPEWMQEHFPEATKVVAADGSVTWTAQDTNGWKINAVLEKSGDLKEVYLLSPSGERVTRGLGNPKKLNDLLLGGKADGSLTEEVSILRTRGPEDSHYLVLPKDGVTGIEDPRILQNSAPNYFADALDPQLVEKANLLDIQRSAQIFEQHGMNPAQAQEWAKFVSDHYRPAPAVTVNSPYSRSQELLHLHLDHIDPKIHGELAKIAERNGFSKTSFESIEDLIPGEAENLKAMWVPADAQGGLGDTNPFKKVYESLPDNLKPTIDEHSIALVPMKYQNAPGFLIIDGQASMKGAALEWLQHYTAWMNEGKPNL